MINKSALHSYTNGTVLHTIYEDGTLIKESINSKWNYEFPSSIDVKITDYCDMGCVYCHESSTMEGKHGDLEMLLDVLTPLPEGVELAIGGGNPLSHPDLINFLYGIKSNGLIPNLTVNQGHVKTHQQTLIDLLTSKLIYGLGISIINNNYKYVDQLFYHSNNIVFHIIAGVHDVDIMDRLIQYPNAKILILGYKKFGFGQQYYSSEIEKNIKEWYQKIPRYFKHATISFDNLAIDQLKIKRLFTDEGWDKFYMGDDFTHSMYIDAVEQTFAPTSRSSKNERVSWNDIFLIDYFQKYKK